MDLMVEITEFLPFLTSMYNCYVRNHPAKFQIYRTILIGPCY